MLRFWLLKTWDIFVSEWQIIDAHPAYRGLPQIDGEIANLNEYRASTTESRPEILKPFVLVFSSRGKLVEANANRAALTDAGQEVAATFRGSARVQALTNGLIVTIELL